MAPEMMAKHLESSRTGCLEAQGHDVPAPVLHLISCQRPRKLLRETSEGRGVAVSARRGLLAAGLLDLGQLPVLRGARALPGPGLGCPAARRSAPRPGRGRGLQPRRLRAPSLVRNVALLKGSILIIWRGRTTPGKGCPRGEARRGEARRGEARRPPLGVSLCCYCSPAPPPAHGRRGCFVACAEGEPALRLASETALRNVSRPWRSELTDDTIRSKEACIMTWYSRLVSPGVRTYGNRPQVRLLELLTEQKGYRRASGGNR